MTIQKAHTLVHTATVSNLILRSEISLTKSIKGSSYNSLS